MPSNLTTLLLSLGFAVPSLLATDLEQGSPWLQFGLGGLALLILYTVLKPLVKSQTDSNLRIVKAMERIAEQQVASTEVQRSILTFVVSAAQADTALAMSMAALNATVGAHLKEDERVLAGGGKPAG